MKFLIKLATLLQLSQVIYCQILNATTAATTTTTTTVTTATITATKTAVNDLVRIDLKINQNLIQHKTSKFRGQNVILRRGDTFECDLYLSQLYDDVSDRIRLEFGLGYQPDLNRGTLFYIPVLKNKTFNDKIWDSELTNVEGKRLSVKINIPSNAPIGIWRFKVSTKLTTSKVINTFNIRDIYVLFNAWDQNDSVYVAEEAERQEYILNEVGFIYIGSALDRRPVGRKWTYGQFHEAVLPVVMHLLDQTRLDLISRANPVKVARAISAGLNSHDDMGLLVGEWNGHYYDGTAPWSWSDSSIIFDKYRRTGIPVRYAQCWVFAGVLTTALRTLGIPARTITNYFSAHEKDKSLTVDKFYSESGQEIKNMSPDTIWNFHVWSEAFMRRPDLPAGFDGWQVVDATPQERSDQIFQLGPASVEAIKQGRVSLPYDVGFVFSEVNADLINWKRVRGLFRQTQRNTWHVGRKMLTKKIGPYNYDAVDISSQYKYPEGSREERQAYEAAKSAWIG